MRSLLLAVLMITSFSGIFLPEVQAKKLSKLQKQAIEAAQDITDEATISAPKDNEVCFSPDEGCGVKFKKFILSAKQSLDIAIFDLSNKDLTDAIIEQSKKIKVRVILDKMQSREKHGKLDDLKAAKIDFRYGRQKGIMHDKFTIVDQKRVETGSYNYTYRASKANQENQVYFSTPSMVERFQKRFDLMWKNAKLR